MYDLEEQEKIDALKDWWKRHGNTVLLGMVVFVATFVSVHGWRYYQRTQAEHASVLFDKLQQGARGADTKSILENAKAVIDAYPRSAYAPRAALIAARASYDAGDSAAAKSQLEWVIANAREPQLKSLGRLRLAGVLADGKQYPEALKLLDAIDDPSFMGLAYNLKGDILLSQGKAAEARAAYQAAVGAAQPGSALQQAAQTKVDSLGAAR